MSDLTIRKLLRVLPAPSLQMGATQVKQPLPHEGLRQLSPFVLLHHFGPWKVAAGEDPLNVGPHPHRGFAPVTLLYQGAVQHRDSLGNEGVIRAGGVQWITAGSGLMHSEHAAPEFVAQGGTLEGLQLWVNLPSTNKMDAPTYEELQAEELSKVQAGDIRLWLVAGTLGETRGPIEPRSPLIVARGELPAQGRGRIAIPAGYNLAVYLLKGGLKVPGQGSIPQEHLAVFHEGEGQLELHAQTDSRFLLLAGEPLGEPLAQYGPFVMNRPEELRQAIQDYEAGKMGILTE